ncbi:DUF4112 domain-containing protein [Halobellus captivus]|uniref:DUF4112 domain-containing protein n=1 Tax=Halobellus captivus TaxID=2592614 RepID=UPI001EF02D5C|nr:DUF4112 domain-containing protein [Halobellus captivus]
MDRTNRPNAVDDDPVDVAPDAVADELDIGSPEGTERLVRLRRLSRLLDSAVEIPGTNVRIGLDPILGLLPGVGDVTATAASAYVVAEAAALGAPRATLARMCLNLLVDALIGSVPLVGDAFDAVWRANDRNVRLLESRLSEPDRAGERRDRYVVLLLGAVVFLGVLAVSALVLVTLWWLLGAAGVLG